MAPEGPHQYNVVIALDCDGGRLEHGRLVQFTAGVAEGGLGAQEEALVKLLVVLQ